MSTETGTHNSMASNNSTHALPKDRQNAKMVTQAWSWAQLPTTTLTLLKQQTGEKKKNSRRFLILGH